MIANIWWGYPFTMLMVRAGLQTVPHSLYDAAIVDGANYFQLLHSVIMPWLRPVITIVVVLQTINNLNGFTLVKVMTGGGPSGATKIFSIMIYKQGFSFFHFEYAAAISVIVLIVAFIMALIYIRIISGRDTKNGQS